MHVEREEKGIRVLEEKERERGQLGKRKAGIEEDKETILPPQHPTFISLESEFELELLGFCFLSSSSSSRLLPRSSTDKTRP